MLTTDPIFKKPLLPVITIKNTANNATQYTYSSFTGTATGTALTTTFPLYCSVNLSKTTQGEFTIQFEDPNKAMESTVTVNSRVFIDCGKQSGLTTRLISGLVRKKGYARGADNKILYTITGSSTAIRLNEIIRYVVSEATKTADGITPDKTDPSRKADVLLAANLNDLTADSILSIANLAANSDVENFIASLNIEYGQLQDIVNYIEQQSGGQVVVDQNDLVNFRYEIKNNLTGRGFTIKNWNTNQANDDADDTMYLVGKNWSNEDDFFVGNYSNNLTAIMRAEPRPSSPLDLGFVSTNSITIQNTNEYAIKFRPTHTRFTTGDLYIIGSLWMNGIADINPVSIFVRICEDNGAGVPLNTSGVIGNYIFFPTNFQSPLPTVYTIETSTLLNDAYIQNCGASGGAGVDFLLDTTKDYWLIFSNFNLISNMRFSVGKNENATLAPVMLTHSSNFSTTFNGGSGWTAVTSPTLPCFGIGRYRSTPYNMIDPKAAYAVQSGLTAGPQGPKSLFTESMITESPIEITTRDVILPYMARQLYNRARPSTTYNFPAVMAPNIPPFPGDAIVISDTILDLSTSGNQVALTTCGDMSYQWGNMGTGSYEAPTILSIQGISTHPRYR